MKRLVKKYSNLFKHSTFLRSVSVLVSGQVIGQVIALISIPIISRLYTEKDFGEYAIFSSTARIILGIGALGLSSAIMAPRDQERSKEVFFTAFFIEIVVFSLFLIIALILAPFFKFYTISVSYLVTIVLSFIYMVLNGVSGLLSTYMNKLKQFRQLFWNSVITGISILFITIPLGYLGFGVLGFIIAGICGSLASNIQMIIKSNPFQKILSINEMLSVCKEFKDYIIYQFPSNWISTFTTQLPNQIFSNVYGNTALGGYSMSERALGYPILLIATPVGTIYFRHATQFVHEGRMNDLAAFTFSFILKILKIAFIPSVLFMVFSKQLFGFILGSNWQTAGLIASILTIQYVFKFCDKCIGYCMVVLNKQKENFLISIIKLSLIAISLSIGVIFFEGIFNTILCLAIGSTIAQMIILSVDFYYLGIRWRKFLPPLLLFAVGAAILAIAMNLLLQS